MNRVPIIRKKPQRPIWHRPEVLRSFTAGEIDKAMNVECDWSRLFTGVCPPTTVAGVCG